MPLEIVRNDITQMDVDAIVNAANRRLRGGGGVDGAIHRVAGPGLMEECRSLGGCPTGCAKVTGGYNLPAKYVIHAVGPVWFGGRFREKELLESAYRTSLELARELGCRSVAFPLISAGAYGYPKDQAIRVATQTIGAFLMEHDMMVYLVVFDRAAFQISSHLFTNIQAYIDENYVSSHGDTPNYMRSRMELAQQECPSRQQLPESSWERPEGMPCPSHAPEPCMPSGLSLEGMLAQIDESFSEMLLRKIDELGIKDSQCYKRANISRKLFSKIRSDRLYKPSKPTVLAFAIALELPLSETRELLQKAGFALSRSNKFDIIVEYFIRSGNYDIFQINEALFAFDQSLLGG